PQQGCPRRLVADKPVDRRHDQGECGTAREEQHLLGLAPKPLDHSATSAAPAPGGPTSGSTPTAAGSIPARASRSSNTGRSERIGGRRRKLWCGGGEDVAHSSELPPHGSSPAVAGPRSASATATRNGMVPRPSRNAPSVDSRFRVHQPVLAA